MTSMDKIEALAWEARRRRTSYGELARTMSARETEEVYRAFREYRAGRRRKAELGERLIRFGRLYCGS